MKKLIIFVLIGVILVTGVIATGTYGLSEENIEIYQQAVKLQSGNENFGFEGFFLTDYPVSFYDGNKDYVVVWENNTYSITKRKATINSLAATAYPIDGHYEVLTPTIEKMTSLLGLFSTEDADYGTEEHISTLWHEAFHCWQLTNYLANIEAICPVAINEKIIAEQVDTNEKAVALFKQQSTLLEDAVKSGDVDKIREYIVRYKELDEERDILLSAEAIALEEYYTRVEGSACYIEACVYQLQCPDSIASSYIDTISEYSGGSGKYYKSGMAMCMILDAIDSDWKDSYDFSEPLINLIYKELEI
ncbi:MAG: hypothetical protein IJN84_07940 [Clostridia bacterium]|nr:hypothetical protein [Clostridia bacterium]